MVHSEDCIPSILASALAVALYSPQVSPRFCISTGAAENDEKHDDLSEWDPWYKSHGSTRD